jgi:excisionase family DNA binding protein
MEKVLLTVPEAAGRLSIGATTLRLLIRRGEIPVVHIGSAVRIHRREVDRWAEERSQHVLRG